MEEIQNIWKNKELKYKEIAINWCEQNELKSYLLDIEDKCKEKLDILTKQMAEKENVNEELKANDQLERVAEWIKLKIEQKKSY